MRQAKSDGRLGPVHDGWQLETNDATERRLFATLDATLALPSTGAGPRNRNRHVVRIDTAAGVFFLKTFERTQPKNRLRFLVTAPRANDDAEREARVATALHDAGFGAPRPVARGRRGAASFLLLAAVPGRACEELVHDASFDASLARRVAEHCGRLLAAGFWLPDLGADHVFVDRAAGGLSLSVIDLHNGRIARRGPPPHRVARRVLRRFARSLQHAPWPFRRTLTFAVRLLRAAELRGDAVRRVLASLPPVATAARYEVAGKSHAYAERNPQRTRRELTLLRRVWPGRSGETVLDLPCGAGRLLPMLRELGHRVVGADGAFAMLQQTRARTGDTEVVRADALAIPFGNGVVDGVVMFRFLHHLAPDARRRAIAEACRTARRFVVASFFHPCSAHHLQRRLRQLGGATPTRFAVTLRGIVREFASHGFELHAKAADLPFARDLWVASFVRNGVLARRPVGSAP